MLSQAWGGGRDWEGRVEETVPGSFQQKGGKGSFDGIALEIRKWACTL